MATAAQQLEELLNSMVDPMEDEVAKRVTGVIYGDSGGGKTVEAMMLAQKLRQFVDKRDGVESAILFIDAVTAWTSIRNHPDLQVNVRRLKYEGKSQLELIATAAEFGRLKTPDDKPISVIVLDELSAMTDRDGDIVLAARSAADSSKDPDVLTQPDMGATIERMRRTVISSLLVKAPQSIIFVAHQRNDEDKAVGYKTTRPRFMPKFSGSLRENLDFVVHMSAKPMNSGSTISYERLLQCHPTTTVVAKSRVGGLALKVTPETFNNRVIEWLGGNIGDSTVTTVVDDKLLDTSENEVDFSGFEV